MAAVLRSAVKCGTPCLTAARLGSRRMTPGPWLQGNDGQVPLHCRAALSTGALPTLLPPPDAGPWGHVAADVRALSPLEGGAPLRKVGCSCACSAQPPAQPVALHGVRLSWLQDISSA